MTTAVDSNVVLDYLAKDPRHGAASLSALREGAHRGRLIACEVVWAEILGTFDAAATGFRILEDLRIEFVPMDLSASSTAATAWHGYRKRGGPRTRIVADFLIGAHAAIHADRLLTRDRGFYRSEFRSLEIVDPSHGTA